jgi:hypothetical protein
MSITYSAFQTLRVLNQIMQNMTGLQHDMVANANTWNAMAVAQNPDALTIAQYMHDAAASYETRLGWVLNYRNTSPNWNAVAAMYAALGGVGADVVTLYNEMKAVADALSVASITTYPQIQTACGQITAAVQAPDSLWPE